MCVSKLYFFMLQKSVHLHFQFLFENICFLFGKFYDFFIRLSLNLKLIFILFEIIKETPKIAEKTFILHYISFKINENLLESTFDGPINESLEAL